MPKTKRKNIQLLPPVHNELVAIGQELTRDVPATMSPAEIIKALIDEHNERKRPDVSSLPAGEKGRL